MEIEKSTYTKRDHLLEEQRVFFETLTMIKAHWLTSMMGSSQ